MGPPPPPPGFHDFPRPGYLIFLAEQKLLAVSALVISPTVGNRAPEPVKEICFRHEILPRLSFQTWQALEFDDFCSRLHNTVPVHIYLSIAQAVIFSGGWCYNSLASCT
jgi:hypothetical protein